MKNEVHKWTEKQSQSAKTPNYGKKYVGEPATLKLMGEVNRKKILELGSGNGYWLNILAKKKAVCTGVEISEEQIRLAKNSNQRGIRYVKADITMSLSRYGIKQNNYDIILLEHVLLEIPSKEKIMAVFKNCFKTLKKGGRVIISDLHPFAPSSNTGNIRRNKNYNYFSSGEIIKIVSKRIDGKETFYSDFHWTLEDLAECITRSGLKIDKIIEPRPSEALTRRFRQLSYRRKIPMRIMIRAKKV